MSEGQTEASIYQQAENGKTELSLMHFTIKNPHWQPPQESSVFISHLKEKVHHDAQGGPSTQLLLSEAPLCTSLHSNESAAGVRVSTRVGHIDGSSFFFLLLMPLLCVYSLTVF